MKRTKLASLIAGAALVAVAAGCSDTATNTNTNTANHNSNAAVVVNSNNANTGVVSTTNSNTNANTANTPRGNFNANMTREEYDRDKDRYTREAKEAGDSIGQSATDGWLWVKTKAALAGVNDLRDSTINVDVNDGVITLRGDVATAEQVRKADTAAKSVEGEKSVQNKLKVTPVGGTTNKNANLSNTNKKG